MSFVYFVSLLAYGFEPFSGDLCDYEKWYSDQKNRCNFFDDIENIETSPGGMFCGCFNGEITNIEIKEMQDEVILRGCCKEGKLLLPIYISFRIFNTEDSIKKGRLSVVYGNTTQLVIVETIIKDKELHSIIYSPEKADRSIEINVCREGKPSLPVDINTEFRFNVKYTVKTKVLEINGRLSRKLQHFEFKDKLINWKRDIEPLEIKGINSDMLFAICKLNNKWLSSKASYPWLSYFCGLLANVGCAGIGGFASFLCSAVYGAINTYIQNHS